MKLTNYIKTKAFSIFIVFLGCLLLFFFLNAFKLSLTYNIFVICFVLIFYLIIFIHEFIQKKFFYDYLLKAFNELNHKYYISMLIENPSFLEGQILYDLLTDLNKNLKEEINQEQETINNFKEYLELWIHEIKIPIASAYLMMHNDKNKKLKLQLDRIDTLIEQVLYYSRSENAELDYLIKNNNLENIVNEVILKNKDLLLAKKIKIELNNLDKKVLTDTKWLQFILNELINNAIKYSKESNASIKISCTENDKNIILSIFDNGIGIPKKDLPSVFQKSFTGSNGHHLKKATGMGLYICHNLCTKLGHLLEIESQENEYTKVNIIFAKNDFYETVRLTKM